jgi:hypothetical protein
MPLAAAAAAAADTAAGCTTGRSSPPAPAHARTHARTHTYTRARTHARERAHTMARTHTKVDECMHCDAALLQQCPCPLISPIRISFPSETTSSINLPATDFLQSAKCWARANRCVRAYPPADRDSPSRSSSLLRPVSESIPIPLITRLRTRIADLLPHPVRLLVFAMDGAHPRTSAKKRVAVCSHRLVRRRWEASRPAR